MPTYEFRCPKGHDFEKFYRSISAAPLEVTCPVCGKIAERQLSAGGGLVFKGSGFYITDYGKDGKKQQTAPAVAGEGATPASGPEAEKKTESAGMTDAQPSSEVKSSPEVKQSAEGKASGEAKRVPSARPAAKTGSPKREKGGE